MSKLWGGRFAQSNDFDLTKLNNSLPVDSRLYAEDIEGSKAYAIILAHSGIITTTELQSIHAGLDKVLEEWKSDTITFLPSDEDVHTVNERRLTEIIGSVGGKLHTGRSRNDQVATDMKLWIKKAIVEVIRNLVDVLKIVVQVSERNIDVIMPGYTHLQQAQPIRFAHWLLSYGFSLEADLTRFHALHKSVDVSPLGSGAIAGNPFGIDRVYLANLLNFSQVTPNSIYGVSDRDFVVEFNFAASLTAVHLSRISEDLIIYVTKEFGFIKLSDLYSTGSSLMPQKRNPDSLELIRGISGELFGDLAAFLVTLKGLPSTYNKDMQSDKRTMFHVYDQLILALKVIGGVLQTMTINTERCRNALSVDMLATDLAYFLVRRGLEFRKAHHVSGEVIAYAEKKGVPINELSIAEYKSISSLFDESVLKIFDFETSIEQYTVVGGTAKSAVKLQIDKLQEKINIVNWAFPV